jgi:enoyl-CoA hydratase/carnithine racemase
LDDEGHRGGRGEIRVLFFLVPGDLVLTALVDGVGVVSFNRPERHNALNDELGQSWRTAVVDALESPSVRCILLCGEGPSFCSGRDTAVLGHRAGGESDLTFVARAQEIRIALLESPKPVVAAVQGHALGGGFETALGADMRIAGDDAVFGFPEVGFGLVADTGGTQLLTPLIGPSRAKYLLMTGARIDAAQALAWGAVDWVVPAAELRDAALELARRLAAAPATAVGIAKQLVDQAWMGSIRNGMRQEVVAQATLFASDDYQQLKARRAAR